MTTPIEPADTTVATLAARAREAAAAAGNAGGEGADGHCESRIEGTGQLIVFLDEYPAFAPSADPNGVASNFARRVSLSSVAPNAAELMWPSAETKE
ncbi:hypothetical protein [Rhodococcus erythropolis]|uniref:hypothetical protein n=1 Tax=Rhodococcus erythropolis TaxID=1833 RepID=UPI001BE917AF|nr:hypothetical protein [Rhodococcus erythropolis]MBT2269032.1 hypothetical protein [Rhodococcus erythropolis]